MVEFDSLDTAKQAKIALEGSDIYAGCCTLRIGFAKVSWTLNFFPSVVQGFFFIRIKPNQNKSSGFIYFVQYRG